MKPIRVAHITNEAFGFDTANGVQQVVYCLAHAQADLGQPVAVFSREDHAVNVLGGGAESASRTLREAHARSGRSIRERLLSRYFEQTLADDVLAWRPDIVHFHSVHIPQNVVLAAFLRRADVSYCVTVHGALFRTALRRRLAKKTVFKAVFERRYLNEARFIQALSPHEVGPIKRYGVTAPVIVIPNGLPPDATVPASQPAALYEANPLLRGRQVFMFIGRLDPRQKGLDLLLEAFARAGLRQAALVLVGPDWFGSRRRLGSLAKRLRISSQVVFTGPAFGEDRANLFAAADVFVHPSRWEGLSLSVLAAAAAGKPCLITRDADPFGALERAHAAIVVETSVPSIADGLRRAATLAGGELQNMGVRARRVAEADFTWPPIASKLIEAYRSAIGEGHHDSN